MACKEQIYDLLILTDATASMGSYLMSLNESLPEIIRISALTAAFDRIGVLAYRDYCGGKLTEWSGWYSADETDNQAISQAALLDFAKGLKAEYGGDWPEATKTGLAHAYEVMRADAATIMLLYTDAPPHMPCTGGQNRLKEKSRLSDKMSYSGYGPLFEDWVAGSRALERGEKKAVVFALVQSHLVDTLSPYVYLSTLTGGMCLQLADQTSLTISKLTMSILLGWMGVGKAGAANKAVLAHVRRYKLVATINKIQNEDDKVMETYFLKKDAKPFENLVKENLDSTDVSLDNLKDFIAVRDPPLQDFSKKYVADVKYRNLAISQLRIIIASDVKAVAVNPVFGSLWRTICNDRDNEARDELIQSFGLHVDRIANAEHKARMKSWLEESYDYAADIVAIIKAVPKEERFPCVYLDPTQDFKSTPIAGDNDDENPEDRPINKFTREELLEIGRSCDYRILRRLGKVLTRLSYVSSEEDLPAHIAAMTEEQVPRVPLALTKVEHKMKFWKILLHVVLPGTMLSVRPAALLAALSLRMGMLPLRDAADTELIFTSKKWNTLEIPETWNASCLSLLLDADKDYETRVKNGTTARREGSESTILGENDRRLFQTLVNYKMLELNLDTTLRAQIGWSPEKSKVALGPIVVCKNCNLPRSVTMMSQQGVCGHCTESRCPCAACLPAEDHDARVRNNVSTYDSERTEGTWVECFSSSCRGQYVVYNPNSLRVRPKCFYCRHSGKDGQQNFGPAPLVECSQCLNRIIWPEEYRPANLDLAKFRCSACETNRVTIIERETTPHALMFENGNAWLLQNNDGVLKEPFNGRSLFYTASHADLAGIAEKLVILPESRDLELRIRGKLVRNVSDVHASLQQWVLDRRTEAGVCSLCFNNLRKTDLRRACGRSGCHQMVCSACMEDWYGLNSRGRIINVAALSCPFCRRQPAAKAVNSFGIAQLGGLRNAVEEAGSWIYAWCWGCGFAKQFVERICAAGAPPEIGQWECDECKEKTGKGREVKNCPGCGTPTEKMGGCDHIACAVPGCDAHWCFNCRANVGQNEIYDHMTQEHGGWYGGQEDEEYDGYDD
jgi:hypothetical protein